MAVESLYNDYDFLGAFSVAPLLAELALVTLTLKTLIECRLANAATTDVRAVTR